ncbi:hypothetical protein HZS_3079 [Henneguya salminicola]|nr:hypothetical protein HZS_3079 [Henneguya salminicola]
MDGITAILSSLMYKDCNFQNNVLRQNLEITRFTTFQRYYIKNSKILYIIISNFIRFTKTLLYPKNVVILFDAFSINQGIIFKLFSQLVLSLFRTINSNDLFNLFTFYGDSTENTLLESLTGNFSLIPGYEENILV